MDDFYTELDEQIQVCFKENVIRASEKIFWPFFYFVSSVVLFISVSVQLRL